MADKVCVCRSCVDWRENRLMAQHGMTGAEPCFMPRQKGAFVPKPAADGATSSAEAMLVELGKEPVIFIQGHRDCAAVGVLYAAAERGFATNNTEREFLRSYGHVAAMVMEIGAALSREQRLRVLEQICVLAGINNDLEHESLRETYRPVFYALLSETPANVKEIPAEAIPLAIYDPAQGAFGRLPPERGNTGIRITDFVGPGMSRLDPDDGFGITAPIDLDAAARNAVRWSMTGTVPEIERPPAKRRDGMVARR